MRIHHTLPRLLCFFATAFVATASSAADEEMVVTAMKRDQLIQDVPFSINAQSEEDIQRTGATTLEDVSRNVAGLSIQNLGPGQSQVAVRGVSAGQIVRDQPGVKEQVGIYLDESVISLSLFTPDLDLFDLNRVETLRGPQGTLFGSGSVGGTIRYITNQPNLEEFSALVEVDANTVEDSDDLGYHGKGMVNIPLIDDQLALRVVGYHTEYAGFIDARREGGIVSDDVNEGTRTGARVALTYMPTEDITITPRIIYQEIEADGFNREEVYNMFANPFTTTRPAIQLGEREQYLLLEEEFEDEILIADLNLEFGIGPVDVLSISSYTDRDILVSRDASALTGSITIDFGLGEPAALLPSNLLDTTEVEQFTQEIRLSSNEDFGIDWLRWLVGAFYSDTERVYMQRLPTSGYDAAYDAVNGAGASAAAANGFPANSPFNSDLPYDIEQIALFGEASIDVTDDLEFTAGLRWYDFDEERTIMTGGVFAAGGPAAVDKTSSDGITPRFLISYDINENITLNAQASQGFRLGGVNDPLNIPLCSPADLTIFGSFQNYEDETMWNYETGVKASVFGVDINAAVFYADIEDLQVTLDAGSCSSRISFNVPEAHSTGLELELAAEPIEGLDFSVAMSLLEAEFDSTVRDGVGNIIGGLEDGNRLPSVPEFQIAVTLGYNFSIREDGDAYVSATVHHVGDRLTQPSDQVPGAGMFSAGRPFGGATGAEVTTLDLELDSYTIINLNAGYTFEETLDMVLYVNNVTDENADLSFDRERGGTARLGFRTNTPRTVGVTLRKRF